MDGASARQCCIVIDMHVATEHDVVGHDDPITQLTIVRNMAAGHEVATVADDSDPGFLFGPTIDGRRLAENISVTDDDSGRRALIAEILRLGTDHDARK